MVGIKCYNCFSESYQGKCCAFVVCNKERDAIYVIVLISTTLQHVLSITFNSDREIKWPKGHLKAINIAKLHLKQT